MDRPSSDKPAIRVLALDGGGIRGLSSLVLLRDLMQRIAVKENTSATLRPSDYFELIIGTGTGGISALFVGRMRMTVDEAIEAYLFMAKEGFRRPTASQARLFRKDQALLDGDSLTRVIGDVVQNSLGERDTPLRDPASSAGAGHKFCRTAVLASSSTNASDPPVVFRSYTTNHPASPHSIHEVARATVSTAGIFPPISLGRPPIKFIDAGVAGYNNPAETAVHEVSRVWPGAEISCLVSLGAGLQNVVRVGKTWKDVMEISRRIMEECEQVHYRLLQQKHREGLQYFRLNVTRGLDRIGVMEWDEETSSATADITAGYTRQPEVEVSLNSCVGSMVGEMPHTPTNLDTLENHVIIPEFVETHLLLGGRFRPTLVWDISQSPVTARQITPHGTLEHIPSNALKSPATEPGAHFMRIVCDAFPWYVQIRVSRNEDIRVEHVLDATFSTLQEPLELEEWKEETVNKQRKILKAMCSRLARGPPEFHMHVKRIDRLGDKTFFMGLRPLGPADAPEEWLLELGPPQQQESQR